MIKTQENSNLRKINIHFNNNFYGLLSKGTNKKKVNSPAKRKQNIILETKGNNNKKENNMRTRQCVDNLTY